MPARNRRRELELAFPPAPLTALPAEGFTPLQREGYSRLHSLLDGIAAPPYERGLVEVSLNAALGKLADNEPRWWWIWAKALASAARGAQDATPAQEEAKKEGVVTAGVLYARKWEAVAAWGVRSTPLLVEMELELLQASAIMGQLPPWEHNAILPRFRKHGWWGGPIPEQEAHVAEAAQIIDGLHRVLPLLAGEETKELRKEFRGRLILAGYRVGHWLWSQFKGDYAQAASWMWEIGQSLSPEVFVLPVHDWDCWPPR